MTDTKLSKSFLLFWLSQAVSSFGSSLTSFTIVLWAYEHTESALVLSMSSIAIMLPKMIGGILVGPLVERWSKKNVLILADLGAGGCSLVLFLLLKSESLMIWQIYGINIISSLFSSFQTPASEITVTLLTTKEHYTRASGLQSLSQGMIQVLAPAFAVAAFPFIGMSGVILLDIGTLTFAILTLLVFVKIPLNKPADHLTFNMKIYCQEMKTGYQFLARTHLLRKLLVFMSTINFFAGLTYYSLLSPLILIRTNHDASALALVNGALGLGAIVGSLIVSALPSPKKKIRVIFCCAGLSFLFGDLLLAIGQTLLIWTVAAFLSSVFLPMLNATESYLWRISVPLELQGRLFSLKHACQLGMIPLGSLLGGILADYYVEPWMLEKNIFSTLLGNSNGAGMSLLFLGTAVLGVFISGRGFFNSELAHLEEKM